MMYYRGKKAFSGEGPERPRPLRFGMRRRIPEKKGNRFFLRLFQKKEAPPPRSEGKVYAFYRPEARREEAPRDSRETPRFRFPKFRLPKLEWSWGKKWAPYALAGAVILGGGYWLKGRAAGLLAGIANLKLSRINVEGLHYLTEEQVLRETGVPLGQDMFQVDLEGICGRIRKLDWVEKVYAERRLPQSLLISIRERRPKALLDDGSLYGVDGEGRVLSPSAALVRKDLPLISGLRVPADARGTTTLSTALRPALDFFVFLGKQDRVLAEDVSEVNLSEPGCLKVTFLDGLEARFNPAVTESEMKRMAVVLSDLSQKGKNAGTMDLRYRNMVLVKTR